MKKQKDQSRLWTVAGTVPIPLLAIVYVALDLYSPENTRDFRATLFLVLISVCVLLSSVCIFKIQGWKKILPLLSALTGLIAGALLLFVLTFTFGY